MLALCPGLPARAQEGERFSVTSRVDPPRTETSSAYSEAAGKAGIDTDAVYADELSGSLSSGQAIRERPRRREVSVPAVDGTFGVVLAVVAIVVIILLWLKFGGSGMLLSGKPKDVKKKQDAPTGWNIADQERDLDGNALLAQLSAMKDRREALARLLRHCLLTAGELSDTRFARSDTEREAFARLPTGFKYRDALKTLLRDSELAHYGGRAVSEEMFAHNMQLGRVLLTRGGSHA